ncbi:hypothetical protein ENBRE01_1115 [Enteropsectra breve]|nr:hypothetical protein ENBRE01_1115 [Enteropsectra breve]
MSGQWNVFCILNLLCLAMASPQNDMESIFFRTVNPTIKFLLGAKSFKQYLESDFDGQHDSFSYLIKQALGDEKFSEGVRSAALDNCYSQLREKMPESYSELIDLPEILPSLIDKEKPDDKLFAIQCKTFYIEPGKGQVLAEEFVPCSFITRPASLKNNGRLDLELLVNETIESSAQYKLVNRAAQYKYPKVKEFVSETYFGKCLIFDGGYLNDPAAIRKLFSGSFVTTQKNRLGESESSTYLLKSIITSQKNVNSTDSYSNWDVTYFEDVRSIPLAIYELFGGENRHLLYLLYERES